MVVVEQNFLLRNSDPFSGVKIDYADVVPDIDLRSGWIISLPYIFILNSSS